MGATNIYKYQRRWSLFMSGVENLLVYYSERHIWDRIEVLGNLSTGKTAGAHLTGALGQGVILFEKIGYMKHLVCFLFPIV